MNCHVGLRSTTHHVSPRRLLFTAGLVGLLLVLSVATNAAVGQEPTGSRSVAAEKGKPRVILFGSREYYANPGRGTLRRYLHTFRETPTEFGREVLMEEHRDQITSNQEVYQNFVERVKLETIGEHTDLEFTRSTRIVTITIDGQEIGHRNEGVGSTTSNSMPSQMDDPLIVMERFPGSWL